MKDVGAALAVAAMVAVVIAGGVVASLEVWGGTDTRKRPPKPPPAAVVVRMGPDGTARTSFGDDVRAATLPNSRRFAFCTADMRVERPPTITTDMPDAFCTVTREGRKGPWRISTGGWQQCQAVCFKPAKT